jgi:DNA-binding XRE family transcriptional regulator
LKLIAHRYDYLADQLKTEIARIAKKEVRAETRQLKKVSAQYTVKKMGKVVPKPMLKIQEAPATGLRFRAGGFASLRKKFGMSAEQMGKLIGVSAQSVYHWEAGKSRPRASQLSAIAAARKLTKSEALTKLG